MRNHSYPAKMWYLQIIFISTDEVSAILVSDPGPWLLPCLSVESCLWPQKHISPVLFSALAFFP